MKERQFQMRRCQPSEVLNLMAWLEKCHYKGYSPAGCVAAFEFCLDGRIGGILIGRPEARELNADRIMEFTRVHFIDETEHCIESSALARVRKHIRVWYPLIRLVLAYSDPAEGHLGTIYEADGWAPFGRTKQRKATGWKSREGRKSEELGSKIRWVRTP